MTAIGLERDAVGRQVVGISRQLGDHVKRASLGGIQAGARRLVDVRGLRAILHCRVWSIRVPGAIDKRPLWLWHERHQVLFDF